jgi:hypothetical protein
VGVKATTWTVASEVATSDDLEVLDEFDMILIGKKWQKQGRLYEAIQIYLDWSEPNEE